MMVYKLYSSGTSTRISRRIWGKKTQIRTTSIILITKSNFFWLPSRIPHAYIHWYIITMYNFTTSSSSSTIYYMNRPISKRKTNSVIISFKFKAKMNNMMKNISIIFFLVRSSIIIKNKIIL